MSYKCAGCVSVNSRIHELHWLKEKGVVPSPNLNPNFNTKPQSFVYESLEMITYTVQCALHSQVNIHTDHMLPPTVIAFL